MPAIPANRLRAFKARKGKSSAPRVVSAGHGLGLQDGLWILALEEWIMFDEEGVQMLLVWQREDFWPDSSRQNVNPQ